MPLGVVATVSAVRASEAASAAFSTSRNRFDKFTSKVVVKPYPSSDLSTASANRALHALTAVSVASTASVSSPCSPPNSESSLSVLRAMMNRPTDRGESSHSRLSAVQHAASIRTLSDSKTPGSSLCFVLLMYTPIALLTRFVDTSVAMVPLTTDTSAFASAEQSAPSKLALSTPFSSIKVSPGGAPLLVTFTVKDPPLASRNSDRDEEGDDVS
mmetsp:Transcript_8648/g.32379  ORF Transcript_8648/g.32379 Transcript_8648/m.32379 type:complete len:214 (+) Transcript_8648:6046-6687(+)